MVWTSMYDESRPWLKCIVEGNVLIGLRLYMNTWLIYVVLTRLQNNKNNLLTLWFHMWLVPSALNLLRVEYGKYVTWRLEFTFIRNDGLIVRIKFSLSSQ